MATQHPLDDRQHGHAIRRRQGGRTSIYHEQLYPAAAKQKAILGMTDFTDEFTPAEKRKQAATVAQDIADGWDRGIRASDTSTGAF